MRLSPSDYCNRCWEGVRDYVDGIDNDTIVVGKYIKKVLERYKKMLLNKETYVFRTSKVDKVFKFFSLLNSEHKNVYGQTILLPWQCFFLSFAYGFYYKNDPEKRVFREILLFMARKNGKSFLAAALQLYGMVADDLENPQSLLLANTSQQAHIALNFAKNIVVHTPELNKRLIGQRSRIIFRDYEKQGFCQTFASMEPARLEGYSVAYAILDECHGYEDNMVYAALKTGTGARLNPMLFLISTAGSKNNGFLNDYLKRQKQILDGIIEDDTCLSFIYEIDEHDEISDVNNWYKSNPSMDYILSMDDLKRQFNSVKHSTADLYFFLTKHLNIFYDTPDTWIPEQYLHPIFENFDESQLLGRDCYVGMDLSKNTDLSSIVLYFPGQTPDEVSYAIPYFWIADMPGNIVRKSGKDITNYILDGWITKCDSKTIDLDLIFHSIIELSTRFNILCVYYDPYNSPSLISNLKEAGIPCEIFKQTASKFNAPLKFLETSIYNRTIRLKNPCLLWNFSNIVLYVDGNANVKIVKNKQADSVDGCVALAMAVGGWLYAFYGDEALGLTTYLETKQ